MSRRTLAVVAGAALLFAAPALAQAQQSAPVAKPSPSGAPAAAPAAKQPQIKTIYDYKAELGLDDTQISKLRATLGGFAKDTGAKRDELLKARQDYARLVEGHGALDAMKVKLQQIGALEFDLRWLDVTTSRNIESILSPAQLTKWRTLQAEARKQKK